MKPSNPKAHRRQRMQPCAEVLETRSLLTGGAGNTFALVPGEVATAGGSAIVKFTLTPSLFTLPHSKMVVGIDVVPKEGSKLQPLISRVDNPHQEIVSQAITTINNPRLTHSAVARGAATRAVLVPLIQVPKNPGQPATYTAVVSGKSKTSGDFLVGFYLPGDVDGSGIVDQADLNSVRAELGAKAGDKNYDFNADVNRDGRIGPIDLSYTRQNQGVRTTVSPLVTVNLDNMSDSGATDRITNIRGAPEDGSGLDHDQCQRRVFDHRSTR
jgi:dockerin type I repeat protein